MYCNNCGTFIDDDSTFCSNCGHKRRSEKVWLGLRNIE